MDYITTDAGLMLPRVVEQKSAAISNPSYFGLDAWVSAPTAAGPTVNANTAMNCSAVNICVSTIADALATLPLKVIESVDAVNQTVHDHPACPLLHDDANPWTTSGTLRGMLARDALTTGNGFAMANRLPNGEVVELHRCSPYAVSILQDTTTHEPVYRVSMNDGSQMDVDWQDMVHVTSGHRADDGLTGVSPVHHAREAIALVLVMQQTAAATFKNNARPGGVITLKDRLGEEAAKRMRTTWNAANSGDGQGQTVVLEQGATFEAIQLGLAENQFGEAYTAAIVDVCRTFGVPPSLAFELGRATWSNSVELRKQFVDFTLRPHLREFEAAFKRVLIGPQDRQRFNVQFDTDEFLRTDIIARSTADSQWIAARVITPNEVRARENLPPLPGGDELVNPFTTSGGVNNNE